MLEEIEVKHTPLLTLTKIISILLMIAIIACLILAYLPVPENYSTEEGVRASRAYQYAVNAVRTALSDLEDKSWNTTNYGNIASDKISIGPITWIYTSYINGSGVYLKFDYTYNNERGTKYYSSTYGKAMTQYGYGTVLSSKEITEEDYNNQKPKIPLGENTYNEDVSKIILSDAIKERVSKYEGYSHAVELLKDQKAFLLRDDVKIVSISFKYDSLGYVDYDAGNSVFKIVYEKQTETGTTTHTNYYFINQFLSPKLINGKLYTVVSTNFINTNSYNYSNNYNNTIHSSVKEVNLNDITIDIIVNEAKGE